MFPTVKIHAIHVSLLSETCYSKFSYNNGLNNYNDLNCSNDCSVLLLTRSYSI